MNAPSPSTASLPVRGLLIAFGLLIGVLAVLVLGGSSGQATFPGENGDIYFAADPEDNGQRDLFRMNSDGSNVTQITNTEEFELRPSVSVDGSMITYQRATDPSDTDTEIFVANADGSGAHQISTLDPSNGGSFSPSWSPDGTQIAFAYSTKTSYELWVVDADGDNPQMIAENIRPTTDWSPDGEKILFTKDTGDSTEIAVVNPDGTGETPLTSTKDLEERAGSWSPDGEMIAFQTFDIDDNFDTDIEVMDADGSNRQNLTNDTAFGQFDPDWSPDGNLIVFERFEFPTRSLVAAGVPPTDLWVMDADGSDPQALTKGLDGPEYTPDWASSGPAPTPTPEPVEGVQGDVDCDIDVDAVDALKDLRHVAALSVSQTEPCPNIETPVGKQLWGDVDCDGDVDAVDALKILRHVAALPVTQNEPCIDLGLPFAPLKGEGDLEATVVNAVTGDPIEDADVILHEAGSEPCSGAKVDSTTTNGDGQMAFENVPAGFYHLSIEAGKEFISICRTNILILGDRTTGLGVGMSPILEPGELRIILTWGEDPSDLDSHLWLPKDDPFHICFVEEGDAGSFPFAFLDLDDTSSFGPETVTIIEPQEGTYTYAVHNFSDEFGGDTPINESGGHVEVFGEDGFIASFDAPTSGDGFWWHVFDLNAETGQVTGVNQIGDDPEPYDSGFTCP